MSDSEFSMEMADSDSDFDLENDVKVVNKPVAKKAPAKKAPAKKGRGKKAAAKKASPVVDMSDSEEEVDWGQKRNSIEKAQLSKKFQKKTQLEHIMLRPDTYIGSVEEIMVERWVFDADKQMMVNRVIKYVPGLYKIFDEILVNAADNKQRDPSMKAIKVTIDEETGEISVWNDGRGIPIELHQEHNIYIPELVFGHLLTGENFEDTDQRVVGGRNGYGAKLANIFSTNFTVETNDARSGQTYIQEWSKNMSVAGKPTIKKSSSKKEYTKITFTPDYARFGMPNGLDKDTVSLLTKRVFDIAGVTDKSVKVSLNGKQLPVNTFEKYIDLYLGQSVKSLSKKPKKKKAYSSDESDSDESEAEELDEETKRLRALPKIYEKINDRWEVCVTCSQGQFEQVSFVNSICTMNGGQHVNHLADKVSKKLIETVKKKVKGMTMKPFQIKTHLWVFVNALIVNPAFDSQTKDSLTTVPSKFGPAQYKPEFSEKTLKKIDKCGLVDNVVYWAKAKSMKDLARKAGAKKTKVTGIDKLDDANKAGSKESHLCTLILTEGDSAKTLAISGLSVVGRDYYGVFPLKGKLLNVRDAGHQQILKNQEIQNIMKIMGLVPGKVYNDVKGLRYGHIMIMTDQDHDGSHIKGLLFNFVHHFWPALLEVPTFIRVFITPIVKATKGNTVHTFYTMPEYEEWCEEVGAAVKTFKIKYYKGLGTSTAKEAKEYFAALTTHMIDMKWEGAEANECLTMAFSKKKVSERKQWLAAHNDNGGIDFNVKEIEYKEFVNKELVLFSIADNQRSIPCIVDGMKPSQRKVLFACFKRNLKNEIKVAQLAGYTSEHSAYHHGEVSLSNTITGMAQNFMGSNNINVLYPGGQFGTRILGGKDAASPRYIFTRLNTITRLLYNVLDDPLLKYNTDDGLKIEPVWYIPLLPMVLINGSSGIGTGWSTDIPSYNPKDLLECTRQLINGAETLDRTLVPWYRDFTGTIEQEVHPKKGPTKRYVIRGCFERIEGTTTLIITELPVGSWTSTYKSFLEDEKHFPSGSIKDIREHHTDVSVKFEIDFSDDFYKLIETDAALIKKMKLETTISTTNMVAFDKDGKIKHYTSAEQILRTFYPLRLEFYEKRKAFLENQLEQEYVKLSSKARFVQMVCDGEIELVRRKKDELVEELKQHEFVQLEDSYDYLLDMKIHSLTVEQVQKLRATCEAKEAELALLRTKSKEDLYLEDLDEFEKMYEIVLEEEEKEREEERNRVRAGGKKTKGRKKRAPAKKKTKAAPKATKTEAVPKATASKKVAPKPAAAPPKEDDSLAARLARKLQAKKNSTDKDKEEELVAGFEKMVVTPIAAKTKKRLHTTPFSSAKEVVDKKKQCNQDTPEVVKNGGRQRRAAAKKTTYVDLVDSDASASDFEESEVSELESSDEDYSE